MTLNGRNRPEISGACLKWIALVTMTIDHIAASVLARLLCNSSLFSGETWNRCYWLYDIMRIIGRMAFPVYCFLLVEGFVYTRSRSRYALRLFLFALLSEIPFDLALWQTAFDFSHNNVYFTLLLGLLCIWSFAYLEERMQEGLSPLTGKCLMGLSLCFFALTAEKVLCTDYGACGILVIALIWLFREQNVLAGFAFGVLLLTILSSYIEIAALIMLVPLYFYRGKRGRQPKYFFYAFYPAHLLLLGGICYLLGI